MDTAEGTAVMPDGSTPDLGWAIPDPVAPGPVYCPGGKHPVADAAPGEHVCHECRRTESGAPYVDRLDGERVRDLEELVAENAVLRVLVLQMASALRELGREADEEANCWPPDADAPDPRPDVCATCDWVAKGAVVPPCLHRRAT